MSLLDTYTNADILVFHEEKVNDSDGNDTTRASTVGIPTRARIQPLNTTNTSDAEQHIRGFDGVKYYSLRFPRSWTQRLGAQAQIEWDGDRWSVFGDPDRHNGSERTRRLEYVLTRR